MTSKVKQTKNTRVLTLDLGRFELATKLNPLEVT